MLLALKEFGLTQIEIERREGDSDSDGEDLAPKGKKDKEAAVEEELGGNWKQRIVDKVPKKGKFKN